MGWPLRACQGGSICFLHRNSVSSNRNTDCPSAICRSCGERRWPCCPGQAASAISRPRRIGRSRVCRPDTCGTHARLVRTSASVASVTREGYVCRRTKEIPSSLVRCPCYSAVPARRASEYSKKVPALCCFRGVGAHWAFSRCGTHILVCRPPQAPAARMRDWCAPVRASRVSLVRGMYVEWTKEFPSSLMRCPCYSAVSPRRASEFSKQVPALCCSSGFGAHWPFSGCGTHILVCRPPQTWSWVQVFNTFGCYRNLGSPLICPLYTNSCVHRGNPTSCQRVAYLNNTTQTGLLQARASPEGSGAC